VALGLAVAGPTITLLGALLGWARSGRVTRSSFTLLRSARALDVLSGPFARLAPLWNLLPLVVGLVWLAAATGRRRVAAGMAILTAVGAAGAVLAVLRSPLAPRFGVVVTAVGAAASLVGGLAVLLLGGRRRRPSA
jgi:hypothetical protein